jgi:hypothetical protein
MEWIEMIENVGGSRSGPCAAICPNTLMWFLRFEAIGLGGVMPPRK